MKKIKKILGLLLIIMVFSTTIMGCSNENSDLQGSIFDSNISLVKNGNPNLIPDITYEEAYEHFFSNPQWRGFESEDGFDVVEFSGGCTYYGKDAEVYIQFILEDSENFRMYYAGISVDGEKSPADEQTFLELIYNPFESYSREVLGKELDQDVQDAFIEIFNSLQQ